MQFETCRTLPEARPVRRQAHHYVFGYANTGSSLLSAMRNTALVSEAPKNPIALLSNGYQFDQLPSPILFAHDLLSRRGWCDAVPLELGKSPDPTDLMLS